MDKPISGRCLCGAVTWKVDAEPLFQGLCACDNCRRMTGTEHASFFAVPKAAATTSGETRSYSFKADSGASITRHFCPTCGAQAWSTNGRMEQLMVFPVGGLDDAAFFKPQAFAYHAKAASWDRAGEGCATFEAMPPV